MIHVIAREKMVTAVGDATQTFIEASSLEEMKEQALAAAELAYPGQRVVILLDGYRERRTFTKETGYSDDTLVHEARALIYLEG